MRSDRITEWLQSLGYGRWERAALAGDASARRYERLADGAGQSVILMDAPPDKVSSTSDFLRLADFLSAHGLAAPAVLHAEPEAGLVLLEDLGTTHFADWLTNRPADEAVLYTEATDALLAVQHLGLPAGLTTLDPETAAEMVTVAFDWLPNTADEEMQRTIGEGIRSAVATLSDRRQVLSLRDFHAENLIWRPDREGTERVGLLDFQDAFGAPPAYDLASLLRDARRDVADDTANAMIDRFATATGNRSEAVARDVAILSVQRNLRILGVFARLAKRDGKHRYQVLMPRIWGHLRKDLAHPDLADLRGSLQNAFEELSE